MLKSRTRRIGWAKFPSRRLIVLPLAAVSLAVVFYSSLITILGFPGNGAALTVALLSMPVMFLVGGVCGLKRRYHVSIGFPFTPVITVGPLVVLQSWWMIGIWAVMTPLVGYGYLSQ